MKPIHVNFYSLQRYNEESSFKNVCPTCPDGMLLMSRDTTTGELLPSDCCVACGQVVIYDDIEEVRKQHGWPRVAK
jgi:hypothetical protein